MAAKIDGTWNLHVATRDKPLDFFVLFSSGASLLGSAGQANHAAANAFMDAFAYYRQAHGLPAVSINWGAWADVGAAADRKLDARRGIATMAPQEGLQAFEWVVQESARRTRLSFAQIAVVPIDWETVFAQTAPDREPALFKLLSAESKRPSSDAAAAMTANSATGAEQPLPGEATNLLDALKSAPAEDRRDILVERIRQEVAAVLRIDPDHVIDEQQGLFEMGMDSLMSIELKTRLGAAVGHNLPSTLTFNYPTVAALAQYIRSQHPMDEKAPVSALPADAVRPKDDAAPIPDVGDLSENELAELLSAKLAKIRAAAGND